MNHQLNFKVLHTYDTLESGITLEVVLRLAEKEQRITAKLDTGASFCIFQREYGEALGIQVEEGEREIISTATGTFIAYGHSLILAVLNLTVDTTVYFAAEYTFSRNVLGRQGWLDRIRLGLIDYEGKLYLSDYNDA